jgi:hypothetical protein
MPKFSIDNLLSGNIKMDKSDNKLTDAIDLFYDSRKNIFDICGNVVNKEKFPFINVLSTYLTDIVDSIDIEIKKSAKNSIINWREKKNPKLLSKMINSDENINIINRSMNKITAGNYHVIMSEITDTLMQDNIRKIPDYSKYIFDTVVKKCITDEQFTADYLNFLTAFDGSIKTHITQHLGQFCTAVLSLLEKSNPLKDFIFATYLKEVFHYSNIGIIFGNLYLIQMKTSVDYVIKKNEFNDNLKSCMNNIINFLDWMPADMDELYARIYLLLGVMQVVGDFYIPLMSSDMRELLNDVLKQIYSASNMTNKIKMKVLDIQDLIKTIDKKAKDSLTTVSKPVQVQTQTQTQTQKETVPVIASASTASSTTTPSSTVVQNAWGVLPKPKPTFNSTTPNSIFTKSASTSAINSSSNAQPVVETKPVQRQYNDRQGGGGGGGGGGGNGNRKSGGNRHRNDEQRTMDRKQNFGGNSADDDGFIKIERKKTGTASSSSNNNSNSHRNKK